MATRLKTVQYAFPREDDTHVGRGPNTTPVLV